MCSCECASPSAVLGLSALRNGTADGFYQAFNVSEAILHYYSTLLCSTFIYPADLDINSDLCVFHWFQLNTTNFYTMSIYATPKQDNIQMKQML